MSIRLYKSHKKNNKWFYEFKCEKCNKIFTARGDSTPQSCGCILNSYKNKELPKDSNWKLLSKIKNQSTKINVLCTLCNKEYNLLPQNILEGKSLQCHSCGILKNQSNFSISIGGLRKHKLYSVWDAMIQRCYNINNNEYENYGKRGIIVCDEWKNNSEEFIKWSLDNGWNKSLQIDKDKLSMEQGILPKYSPETCCFLTPEENSIYTKLSKANNTGTTGISWSKVMNKYETYFNRKGIRYRAGYHNSVKEAAIALEDAINNYNNKEQNETQKAIV